MKEKAKILLFFGLAAGMLGSPSARSFELLVPDFQVNQGPGTASAAAPAVAAKTTNEFIVTWAANGAVYALRLDSRGKPLGEEFRVDQGGGVLGIFDPAVAVDGNNNFMIAWVEAHEIVPGLHNFLYARRYDPDGNPSGDAFLVSESSGWDRSAYRPTMAVDQNNTTVIVWYYRNTEVMCENGTIYARRYDASGNPLGSEFFVNQDTGCDASWYPALAVDSLDRWIIAWQDFRDYGMNSYDIYARSFDSTGSPIAADFRVDQAAGAVDALSPAVAADSSNNFIITWEDRRNGDADIYMRCYDSNANPLNINVRVDVDLGTAESLSPSIATQPDGSFLIVWTDYRSGNSDIFVRRFQNYYTSLGGDFRLDQGPEGASAEDPSLVVAPSGVFLFAWSDNRNGAWYIYASLWGEDSDHDGLPDYWENTYPCLQANTVDNLDDSDLDGLFNQLEYENETNPCDADMDQDGLSDGEEVLIYGTNPLIPDTDLDGMPDGWEVIFSCLSALVADSSSDADGDGLTNLAEFRHLTDPCRQDTDHDALSDGEEVQIYLTDPLLRDTDGDGYSDGEEVYGGTDPLDPDSFPKQKIASTEWSYPEGESSGCGQLAGSSPSGLWILVPILAFGLIRFWKNFSRDQ